jgi:hypothetical protein
MDGDPTAETAAPIMRRECPEVFSAIAFQAPTSGPSPI